MSAPVRPAELCRARLAALDASEGRRRRRARDTTPDSLGMALERSLTERVAREDPEPSAFEGWLTARVAEAEPASGPVRAVAMRLLDEWRLASLSPSFRGWLDRGAPSDDAGE
jgi:hypothetical protein